MTVRPATLPARGGRCQFECKGCTFSAARNPKRKYSGRTDRSPSESSRIPHPRGSGSRRPPGVREARERPPISPRAHAPRRRRQPPSKQPLHQIHPTHALVIAVGEGRPIGGHADSRKAVTPGGVGRGDLPPVIPSTTPLARRWRLADRSPQPLRPRTREESCMAIPSPAPLPRRTPTPVQWRFALDSRP